MDQATVERYTYMREAGYIWHQAHKSEASNWGPASYGLAVVSKHAEELPDDTTAHDVTLLAGWLDWLAATYA